MRKTVLLLLVIALLSSTCFAATIHEITFEDGNIHVGGTATQGSLLSVMAVKKDATSIGNTDVGLVYETKAKEDGTYSVDFIINDLPDGTDMSGWYTLSVTDTATVQRDFYFATEQGTAALILALQTAKAAVNETDFKNALVTTDENILKSLGIDFTTHASVKDAVIATMYQNCTVPPFARETVSKDYGKALGYILLNQGNGEGVTSYNPSYQGKTFAEITDASSIAFIKQVMKSTTYANYAAVEEQYKKAYALNEVNTANSSKLAAVLEGYETLLGLTANTDYQSYKSAAPATKVVMTEDMVEVLYIDKAYSLSELAAVIKTVVDANKPQTPIPGPIGGGGGGGGGFAVSSTPAPSTQPNTQPNKNTSVFSDLSGVSWAEKAIVSLFEKGIVNGTGYGTFEPGRSVNREEFVKMLILAIGAYDETAVCEFADADTKAWYYPYVASAYQKGIVTGYADNTFGIGGSLSREEAATMLARCAGGLASVREYQGFADDAEISDWSKEHVTTLYRAGIINGAEGRFNPKNTITRAETAQMLYGYLEGGV
ncbi:MAG: S-layer homology domain-containing protein [Clostridia bacterium]|nr:S-layer homology domain-containing protein [Clostridia bacterium]